jgi:hypothetical protein
MIDKLKTLISKILIGFFVLFFSLSPMFGMVDVAYAQTTTTQNTDNINNNASSDALGGVSGGGEVVKDSTAPSIGTENASKDNTCSVTGLLSALALPFCEAGFFFLKLAINITAGLVYIATSIFDSAVENFILEISDLFGDSNSVNSGIYTAWKAVRDIANIAGFFGAVYMGLMYIIGRADNLKKMFVNLMMFAILTNFSFPIAKFAIDIANVVSLNVYGSMTSNSSGQYQMDKGLGTALIGKMGLSGFIVNEKDVKKEGISSNLSSWTVSFATLFYLLFAIFVFAEAALFILVRGVTLAIYVIFSPLMFIGGLAPIFSDMHKKWRENFVGAVLVGPLLMIFLWVAFKILDAGSTAIGAPEIGLATTTSDQFITKTLVLIFSGLALHYAIKMAKEYSHEAGALVSGVMSGVGMLAGAAVTGGASMALRGTVGRAGAAMAESKWVKEGAESGGFMRRMASRGVGNTGNAMTKANGKFAGATFTKTFNAGLGANATNMNVGKSYKDVKDEKNRKEYESAGGKRGLELAQEKDILIAKHESVAAPNNSRDNVNIASSPVMLRATTDLAEAERRLKDKKGSKVEYEGKDADVKALEADAASKQASFAKVNAKASSVNDRLATRATENKDKVAEKEVAYAKIQDKNADIQRAKELRAKLAGIKVAAPLAPKTT